MEKAYTIAMNIADVITKRKYIDSISAVSARARHENMTWQEIDTKYPLSEHHPIKEGHRIIFEEAYKILQQS